MSLVVLCKKGWVRLLKMLFKTCGVQEMFSTFLAYVLITILLYLCYVCVNMPRLCEFVRAALSSTQRWTIFRILHRCRACRLYELSCVVWGSNSTIVVINVCNTWEKVFWHPSKSHLYGFSPVCMRICFCKDGFCVNVFMHFLLLVQKSRPTIQTCNFFALVWIRILNGFIRILGFCMIQGLL